MQLSNMPRKKYPANSPQFIYLFFKIKKCNMEMTSYPRQDQTCNTPYFKILSKIS
jgi:hypothetical protein